MKVLLINGSPNKAGCTYTALSEVEKTLNEASVETELVHIGAGPVQGCMACRKCYDLDGRCVVDNDLVNRCLEKMEECDGLVVGAPVYYASPAGSMLAFLDRFFYAGRGMAGKPGAAVVSARRAGTSSTLDVLNKYFPISGMPLVPSQYWNMVHGNKPDDVRQDLEGMQTMRTLGRNMAWLLQCIELGKQNDISFPKQEEPKARTNFIR